ncbi:hypothetical protein OPV22_013774 [Ensete ventricosum]|uniref:AT-hook motif nuclear-localized protein n=1 Tax=Ensete ventricosum TaxID=4639 RepID=A0AAV8PJ17_ENSVE|nr:hypothetical protein OPV22_013774 [Ensete ventricosum]
MAIHHGGGAPPDAAGTPGTVPKPGMAPRNGRPRPKPGAPPRFLASSPRAKEARKRARTRTILAEEDLLSMLFCFLCFSWTLENRLVDEAADDDERYQHHTEGDACVFIPPTINNNRGD